MGEPKVHVSCGDHLCVITLEGVLRTPDILAILERHYPLIGHRSLLWNMAKADLTGITEANFAEIAALAASKLTATAARKTAYVVGAKEDFVRVNQYVNTAFQLGVPSEYCVFLDIETARQWLTRR